MRYDKVTVITHLQDGYNLIKRHSEEPSFEIWLGTSTIHDHVANLSFSDAVKLLLNKGRCDHFKEAIKLLNGEVAHV